MITDRFLRLHQILGDKELGIEPLIPVSRASWYRGMQLGYYPRSVKLGRSVAWRESDIQKLIQNLGG